MNLTDLEIGYISGMLDGEGQVSVNSNSVCYVRFNNTEIKALRWIHSRVKVGSIGKTNKIKKPQHKQCYSLWIHGEDAKAVLGEVSSCLIIKRRQAELLLSYPVRILDRSDIKKRVKITQKIRVLNKRGVYSISVIPK